MAIGPWNDANYTFLLQPNAHGLGNLVVNKNTGNVASFPSGAFQSCVLTNMAVDDGLIAGRGTAHLSGDGVNNHIDTQYVLSLLTADNLTMGARFVFNQTGTIQMICGLRDDVDNDFNFFIDTADKINYRFLVGASSAVAKSGVALTDGVEYLAHGVKDGSGLMKLFINGVEPASYDQQDSYGLTSKTWTRKLHVLQNNSAATLFPMPTDLYSFGIAEAVFDASRALEEFNLGRNFGLAGINTGDSLALFEAKNGGRLFNSDFNPGFNERFN